MERNDADTVSVTRQIVELQEVLTKRQAPSMYPADYSTTQALEKSLAALANTLTALYTTSVTIA